SGDVGEATSVGQGDRRLGIGHEPLHGDRTSIPTIVSSGAGNLRCDDRWRNVDDRHDEIGPGLHRLLISRGVGCNAEEAVRMPGDPRESGGRSRRRCLEPGKGPAIVGYKYVEGDGAGYGAGTTPTYREGIRVHLCRW